MPEYRRFVAYFYEYIDGKKQKNAGFAKVELRNGMWRILFRLTAARHPEPPVQVYGFVREQGYLLGLSMGTMRPGNEMMEEWAYRAEQPIWKGKYRLEDLAGIWIASGGGDCYITVWDDEPVQTGRFVLELPGEVSEEGGEAPDAGETASKRGELPPAWEEQTNAGAVADAKRRREEAVAASGGGNIDTADAVGESARQGKPVSAPDGTDINIAFAGERAIPNRQGDSGRDAAAGVSGPLSRGDAAVGVSGDLSRGDAAAGAPGDPSRGDGASGQPEEADILSEEVGDVEVENPETPPPLQRTVREKGGAEDAWRELCARRAPCQPFPEKEFRVCIRILPCDLRLLQRAGCQVGRSNFLLHGFYQYRHLLLAEVQEGEYVLGVPGIRNSQEQYMAQMFGFPTFRPASAGRKDQNFGYWCRSLSPRLDIENGSMPFVQAGIK